MAANVCAKFVSKKIRSIRWKPRQGLTSPNPDIFITGSWDDEKNEVTLWQCPSYEESIEPLCISNVSMSSDVNRIEFCDATTCVAALGDGSVSVFKIGNEDLQLKHNYNKIHFFCNGIAPCTYIACQLPEIATVGEDGKINIMHLTQSRPYRTIEADSCSLNVGIFTSQHELLTGNSRGMMKIWDLKSMANKPIQSISIAEDSEIGISTIDRHPSQGHVIVVGSYDGTLTIWDMRKAQVPVTVLAGPDGCLTEVKFHPEKPDNLFTSSESGNLWHWKATNGPPVTQNVMPNVWLSGDLAAQQLDINEVLPSLPLAINCVDVSGQRLICGGDNEAFYYVPYLVV